jgi:isoleucyl-tRNA synthetase
VTEELNALSLTTTGEEEAWATLTAVPDSSLLGKRLGKDLRAVAAEIKALPHAEVRRFMASGTLTVTPPGGAAVTLSSAEVKVIREVRTDRLAQYETLVSECGTFLVAINVVQDDSLRAMGAARELVNRVQRLRKRLRLQVRAGVGVWGWAGAGDLCARAAGRRS